VETFVISSTKTPVTSIAHLENIPQDHDPKFTVASMFKQMQDLCVSFPVYIFLARMGMIQEGLACSNICYKRVNILWHFILMWNERI